MSVITQNLRQEPAEIAIVIPTLLNASLLRAVRAVFRQVPEMALHLLIGIDIAKGDRAILDRIRAECPANVMLTVLDLGYSTAIRHGGVHSNGYSGALRSILSLAANSRLVATLDDNDWYAPMHLALLRDAIAGKAWAFSHRWLVDPATGWPICIDEWDAVGPGHGINQPRFGGFVHPSTLMVDKTACLDMLHSWSSAPFPDGTGEDRLVFEALRNRPYGAVPHSTCFCMLNERSIDDAHHVREFAVRNLHWPQDRALIATIMEHAEAAKRAFQAGDFPQAKLYCDQALAINPNHAESLRRLGEILAAEGHLEGSMLREAQAALLDFAFN